MHEAEPLGIIAAGGRVPVQVARAAAKSGRACFVVGLEGLADRGIEAFPHAFVKWGQIGRVHDLLQQHGIRELVLIGAVDRRPDFGAIGVDLFALRLMPKIVKALTGGDDSVLVNLIGLFEEHGYAIVGAHEVDPDLVAEPGPVAGPAPNVPDDDARTAMEAAGAIGRLDIGQGAVALDRRVVALEAAEGTDAMLRRVGELRANGRLRWRGRKGVLAKRAKPQQDLRVDMPAIGPRTVDAAAEAGLAGIVIEAGRVMIAERDETVKRADATGTFILALGNGGS